MSYPNNSQFNSANGFIPKKTKDLSFNKDGLYSTIPLNDMYSNRTTNNIRLVL